MSSQEYLARFEEQLRGQGAAPNTILTYLSGVRNFYSLYSQATPQTLTAYRESLIARFRPATVNSRILALNRFLALVPQALEQPAGSFRLAPVKMCRRPYLDSVISSQDYERLKEGLRQDQEWMWYFLIRILACTGMRISEALQLKQEHIKAGCLDLCSKGCKMRRIHIPGQLCREMEDWLGEQDRESGFLFVRPSGAPLTVRSINYHLKRMARRYQIPPQVLHPHSFRHLFAKKFLASYNDISLLADLLGHSSIKTTQIYLTRTTQEQRAAIDRIVTW